MSNTKPLRILCLDGGGVRGLSSLYILEELMTQVRYHAAADRDVLPCDYFDMICGTSTGGIISLMLGPLRMSVKECITIYVELSAAVFGRKEPFWKSASYSGDRLFEVVKKRVSNKKNGLDPPLIEQSDSTRKTATGGVPVLLRNYETPYEPVHCTIAEAARATSAAPTFLPPIDIGGEEFVDGGLGCNNPTMLAIEEAEEVRGRENCTTIPDLLVSIGTGREEPAQIKKHSMLDSVLQRSGLACVKALAEMVTASEGTHLRAERWMKKYAPSANYFRFNVQTGLQNVLLDEYDKNKEIKGKTKDYIEGEAKERLSSCSKLVFELSQPITPASQANHTEDINACTQQARSNTQREVNRAYTGGITINFGPAFAGRNVNQFGTVNTGSNTTF